MKTLQKAILCTTLAVMFFLLFVLCVQKILEAKEIEHAAQIEKFGFYKEDVWLDYGRELLSHFGPLMAFALVLLTGVCGFLCAMHWSRWVFMRKHNWTEEQTKQLFGRNKRK